MAVSTQEFARVAAPKPSLAQLGGAPHSDVDDEYLVAMAKRGNSNAYDQIVRRYSMCFRR